MVSPSNTCVQPWAVMVESVDAHVADVAVSASRQDDNRALWAELCGLELFKEFHHVGVRILLDVARVHEPGQEAEDKAAREDNIDKGFQRLRPRRRDVWERDEMERKPAYQHDCKEEVHCEWGLVLSVQGLLDLKELEEFVTALLVFPIALLQDLRHGALPLWAANLLSRVVKCCPALLVDHLRISSLDE